jgi:hypothetical protein
MVVVPLSQPENEFKPEPCVCEAESQDWVRVAASGSLLAGGILLLTGHRRAGLVACASGTALALLDQQEALCSWWNALPGYIEDLQVILTQMQGAVTEISAQRDKIHRVLSR